MEAGKDLEPVVVQAMELDGWKVDAADPHDPQQVTVRIGPEPAGHVTPGRHGANADGGGRSG